MISPVLFSTFDYSPESPSVSQWAVVPLDHQGIVDNAIWKGFETRKFEYFS
jgi:hypothetical protein